MNHVPHITPLRWTKSITVKQVIFGLCVLVALFVLLRRYVVTARTRSGSILASGQDGSDVLPAATVHGVVTATRFWAQDKKDLIRLDEFITRAARYSDLILIAVRTEQDRSDALTHIHTKYADYKSRVQAFGVSPWNEVSTALNSLLYAASKSGHPFILYHSIEIIAVPRHVEWLLSELTSDTLMCGGAISGSHKHTLGTHTLTGMNTPWNTFSVWHIDTLARTGFLMVSDGLWTERFGVGNWIEEVATITNLQMLSTHALSSAVVTVTHPSPGPHTMHTHRVETGHTAHSSGGGGSNFPSNLVSNRYKAKLVHMNDELRWDSEFADDPARAQRQASKLATKNIRAAQQLSALNVSPGQIWHVKPNLDTASDAARAVVAREKVTTATAPVTAAAPISSPAPTDHKHSSPPNELQSDGPRRARVRPPSLRNANAHSHDSHDRSHGGATPISVTRTSNLPRSGVNGSPPPSPTPSPPPPPAAASTTTPTARYRLSSRSPKPNLHPPSSSHAHHHHAGDGHNH